MLEVWFTLRAYERMSAEAEKSKSRTEERKIGCVLEMDPETSSHVRGRAHAVYATAYFATLKPYTSRHTATLQVIRVLRHSSASSGGVLFG